MIYTKWNSLYVVGAVLGVVYLLPAIGQLCRERERERGREREREREG